jgi:hypothetical protein
VITKFTSDYETRTYGALGVPGNHVAGRSLPWAAGVSAPDRGQQDDTAILVVSIILLWAMATIRHAMIRGGKADAGTAGPHERAALL